MKSIHFLATIAILLTSNPALSALIKAEQTYDNGASSYTIFNVDVTIVNGAERFITAGAGINSPDSFVMGSYTSPSGYTYDFNASAILEFIDVYVNTPTSDLVNGFSTGEVFYHYTLDASILASNCSTLACIDEAPKQLSEVAIYPDTTYPATAIAYSTNGYSVKLSAVPLPNSLALLLPGLVLLFHKARHPSA